MFNYMKSIKKILKRKNAQIRAEREKLEAAEAANHIYAAYIVWFASKSGEVHVPKREISELLGKYRAEVSYTNDDYVISVKTVCEPHGFCDNADEDTIDTQKSDSAKDGLTNCKSCEDLASDAGIIGSGNGEDCGKK